MAYLTQWEISKFLENVSSGPGFSNSASAAVTQSDGKILVGGQFSNYGITNRNALIRLNADGNVDTAFCINAADGGKFSAGSTVFAIAAQSDGKILIGGSFTDYAGTVGRHRLIRLNADGTTDTAFCVNAADGAKFGGSGSVTAITVQSDGRILVGGTFTNYAGTTGRNMLIRLNADGTLDTAFCVNATDGSKFTVGVDIASFQPDGKILVAGSFTNYATTTGRSYLIRLNADGTLDTAFCVNATDGSKFNGSVFRMALQSDGRILVGGSFANYAGTTGRNRLLRLNADGTLDTTFCINATDGAKFNSTVMSIVPLSDGRILVGGTFTNYAGTTGRNMLIRLNADGTLDTAFCANATDGAKFNGSIGSAAIQLDGKILVGGSFTNYAGTARRSQFIRLNADGTLDTTFCVNAADGAKFSAQVNSIAVQPDGKILAGGNFLNYSNATITESRHRLIRLNADGTTDTAFCVNAADGAKFGGVINTVATQPDGKILVGGTFTNYAGVTNRNILIRLNADGTTDTAFCANATDSTSKFGAATIFIVVVQPDGKILIGGNFFSYLIANRNRLIRLNSDGTLDTAFCANASDGAKFGAQVNSIAIQPDGKILIGGNFTNYAGTTGRNIFIRLNADGTTDNAFCANAADGIKFSATVMSIVPLSDGKILVGGNFTNYAGTTGRDRLILLNADGTLDTAFCANASDGAKFSAIVNSVTVQSDGKILVGGSFANYAGTTGRNRLLRLNADGTTDTAFCVNAADGTKFGNAIFTIVVQSAGNILVGGSFVLSPLSISTRKYTSCLKQILPSGFSR